MKVQTDLKAGGGLGGLINAIVIVDVNLFGGGCGSCGGGGGCKR
jgi:hypothetical protein